MTRPYQSLSEYAAWFWSRVKKTDECWLWVGEQGYSGYGRTRYFGQRSVINAHRAAWLLEVGAIPEGLLVLHRCDVRPCVRPSHLFLGTALDNMTDMRAKGRAALGDSHGSRTRPEARPRGESVWKSRLTEVQVREIFFRRSEGAVPLSREFAVNRATVWAITHRKSWCHITQEIPS